MFAKVEFRPEASITSEVQSDLNVDSWTGDVRKSNKAVNDSRNSRRKELLNCLKAN
jgi:hypothetical protein